MALLSKHTTPEEPPADLNKEPSYVHYSDLPRAVYLRREYIGREVRVAFYRRLVPTPDPLVYHFHPGDKHVAPSNYTIHFDTPPDFAEAPPVVVVATVEGLAVDLVKRPNGVPGAVVLRAARLLPASP